MVDDYYLHSSAYLSYWSGSGITTDQMHNGVTMGASGDMVTDICVKVSYKNQVKERTRLKKSGFASWRTTEGMLKPAEFSMTFKCNSAVPLSWVHCSDNADASPNTHPFTVPLPATGQQPHISATGTLQIPALCFRVERETGTYALQRTDLLGCVVTELKLILEEGGKAQWEVTGLCEMVLSGVAEITSQVADPSTTVYGWEHTWLSSTNGLTFTYNSKTVAFTPKAYTFTWRLEWEPIVPAMKATTYFVYTNWLLKSWDLEVEVKGLPLEDDGTKVSVFTIARTAIVSYATALLFTLAIKRSATDYISYSVDKMELHLDNAAECDKETNTYEEITFILRPAEGYAITATAADALTKAYYGGAT